MKSSPSGTTALRGPVNAIQKNVAGHRRDDLILATAVNGNQRPAALKRFDEFRAVNRVNEHH